MSKRIRRDCAQLNLRMETAERELIRAAIPYGSINSIAVQLLLDYARALNANGPRPRLPMEDTAA